MKKSVTHVELLIQGFLSNFEWRAFRLIGLTNYIQNNIQLHVSKHATRLKNLKFLFIPAMYVK